MSEHPLKGIWPGLYDPEQKKLEQLERAFLDDFWFAGRAREQGITKDNVDEDELRRGTKVEKEHTVNRKIAARIALDHLAEYDGYYVGLKLIEKLMGIGRLPDVLGWAREEFGIQV